MKILPNKLATLIGVSEDQLVLHIPKALSAIRVYTNRLFLTPVHFGGRINVTTSGITIDADVSQIHPGDVIELLLSNFNTELLIVESVEDNTITVYNSETLGTETFDGYIVKVHFGISVSILINMIKYDLVTSSKLGVKSESLEGYSYTLNTDQADTVGGYPITILAALQNIKQMPGNESREYRRVGLPISIPLYG